MLSSRTIHTMHALGLTVSLIACSTGGPTIDPLEDQVAAVGTEFVLDIKASNSTGDDIVFSYGTDAKVEASRGRLTQRPGGGAVFTWTPSAQDMGDWTFDFKASDATGESTESIRLGVRSTIGADSMPEFRRPLGAGTALDLASDQCVEIEILLEDRDSLEVKVEQEEPIIAGSELYQDSPLAALWSWCPTEEQKLAKDRYLVTLSADDGDNPKALKHYQVILRDGKGQQCPGGEPEIHHVPVDINSSRDLPFSARIVDPTGLKGSPLLYWSSEPINSDADLAKASQLQMNLVSGDTRDGQWTTVVPNIIASNSGSNSRILHYAIVADDDDDKGGQCDHLLFRSYQIQITRPPAPEEGGVAACEPCSADVQCGGSDDLCLPQGLTGESRCFNSCENEACPSGYVCPDAAMTSVDGNSARVCIPIEGACAAKTASCEDDAMEPNNSLADAAPATALAESSQNLMLCPRADLVSDEDWYFVEVDQPSFLNFYIAGSLEEDEVDISLYDETGKVLAKSENWGPSDSVGRCVQPGTYYAQVHSRFDRAHTYTLGYSVDAQTCEVSSCEDDLYEDDDDLVYGRVTDLSDAHNSTGNAICPYDDDWYFVYLGAGEQIHARLDFEQNGLYEDLDLLFYNGGTQTWITECTDERPDLCDSENGQSSDSNERFSYTASEEGYYYVIVHGYSGSANNYDICLSHRKENCGL